MDQPATACHAGRSRGARNLACHTGSLAGGRRVPSSVPFSTQSCPPLRGARRQACHAGGHAGRATHTVLVRSFQSPSVRMEHAILRATPDVRVEHAVLRATPPVLAADGFCPSLPRFWGASSLCGPASSCGAGRCCGAGILACGRHSCRPWPPFTHRPLRHPMPSRVGADQRVRPFSCDLRALACSRKGAVPRGASRQACHAGGHAGRATQSRGVREFPRDPARNTAHSTSSRPLSSYLRVLCTTSP